MFGVKYGAINNLGRQLGLIDVYFDWFSNPFISIVAIVLVEVWHNTAFMTLVLLAGLQSIPQELYDAGKADGAEGWRSFWYITLPLLKFTMVVGRMIRLMMVCFGLAWWFARSRSPSRVVFAGFVATAVVLLSGWGAAMRGRSTR